MLRFLAAAAVGFLAACGGSDAKSHADLAMPDLAPTPCVDPDPPDGSVCGVPVSGAVVDENGGAVAALTVSVCAGQCFYGTTESDGQFTVVPDLHIRLSDYALELHGRPNRVSYYTPLPTGNGVALVYATPLPLPLLPASGPEIAGDNSAQTLTSGDLTLTLAAGTKVLFDVEDYGVPGGHQLRVLSIAQPTSLPFVDASAPPAALYACAPFETAFAAKASLQLGQPRQPAGGRGGRRALAGRAGQRRAAGPAAWSTRRQRARLQRRDDHYHRCRRRRHRADLDRRRKDVKMNRAAIRSMKLLSSALALAAVRQFVAPEPSVTWRLQRRMIFRRRWPTWRRRRPGRVIKRYGDGRRTRHGQRARPAGHDLSRRPLWPQRRRHHSHAHLGVATPTRWRMQWRRRSRSAPTA